MKTTIIYDITLDASETIMTATLSKSNEVVMLMDSGSVIRFNLDDKKGWHLFSVKNGITYSDGGFDILAKTSIYTMDEIVIVVNDYKRHGFVHYPGKYPALHLWRGDYHTDVSTYPIALYKNKEGVPHLIYGENWNHVQLMNLDTRQVLTASKSLIEENAEERHIEFYKNYIEDNKLPWPRPFDYFFGKLFVSPNQKKFLSAGWAWGSYDQYNVFDIENFITNNRISALSIGCWEHENRAACWIDNETVAVAYNPIIDGGENATAGSPIEIHFYKISGEDIEITKKIQISDKEVYSSLLYFNKTSDTLISISHSGCLSVISLDGQIIYKSENIIVSGYNVETNRFLSINNTTISVYEMIH